MTDLYEHQGKALFASAGIPVPRGVLVRSQAEAQRAASHLGYPLVVKAQVLSGGRGKAGGVRLVDDAAGLSAAVSEILGLDIGGNPVVSLLLEEPVETTQEYYLAIALDRAVQQPVLLFSLNGGMDVELEARSEPSCMLRVPVDPLLGLREYQIHKVISASRLRGAAAASLARTVRALWRLYVDRDATLAEINPLSVVRTGTNGPDEQTALAVDAKVSLDDNARFRRNSDCALPVSSEADGRVPQADFTYLRLAGDIGVMGNGAGLVMTLIDLLADAGGSAADFLDMGGGASQQRIEAALDVLLDDEGVSVVLLVVFGGITRCDEVARGLLAALEGRERTPPLVVHLRGTNASEAADLLAGKACPDGVVTAATLREAVYGAAQIAEHDDSRQSRLAACLKSAVDPRVSP